MNLQQLRIESNSSNWTPLRRIGRPLAKQAAEKTSSGFRLGNTHLASALAHRALMAGTSTRFISAADLILQLIAAHHEVRLVQYFSQVVQRPKRLDRLFAWS